LFTVLFALVYAIQRFVRLNRNRLALTFGLLSLTTVALMIIDTFDRLSIINWTRLSNFEELARGVSRWLFTLLTGQVGGQWSALAENFSSIWLTALFWLVSIIGLLRYRRLNNPRLKPWLTLCLWLWAYAAFITLLSEQFMEGLKLITGRVAIFQNLFILPFFLLGFDWFLSKRTGDRRAPALAAVLVGLLFYQNFTSAPALKTVTGDELAAADYINSTYLTTNSGNACVLAEEWPLLALQKVSRNRVQGGGFPIERDFIQNEKDGLFFGLIRHPANAVSISRRAYELTEAGQCLFLFENRFSTDPASLKKLKAALGEPQSIGDVYLFELPKPD